MKALIFLFTVATFFTSMALALELVTGYKGAKWGASYQQVKSAVKTTQLQGNCLDFHFTLTQEAPDVLRKHTGLVGIPFTHLEKNVAPYEFSKNLTFKPVDSGCGLFYKNKFIAYQMVMHTEDKQEIKKVLAGKYGEPKEESDSFIFDREKGTIFLFELRARRTKSPHLVYVSKDLSFLNDELKIAKNKDSANIEKEKTKKKKKLNDL